MKTYTAKPSNIEKEWVLIDAEGLVVGRLASIIAARLRGKHQPSFTPNIDCGDNIVVINAEKLVFTGNKRNDKTYYWHTGHPGGIKERQAHQSGGTLRPSYRRLRPDAWLRHDGDSLRRCCVDWTHARQPGDYHWCDGDGAAAEAEHHANAGHNAWRQRALETFVACERCGDADRVVLFRADRGDA